MNKNTTLPLIIAAALAGPAHAADWPMWGGSPDRNMVGTA